MSHQLQPGTPRQQEWESTEVNRAYVGCQLRCTSRTPFANLFCEQARVRHETCGNGLSDVGFVLVGVLYSIRVNVWCGEMCDLCGKARAPYSLWR